MKPFRLITTASVLLAAMFTTDAMAFDRHTTHALKACHEYLWSEVPKFKDLPNAAISVYPGSFNNGIHVVNWNVNWDDPVVKAGGNCQVKGSEVIGFEDYSR